MKLGYVRVSTLEQHEERQILALQAVQVERIFLDKLSGKNRERPELQRMLEAVHDGDVVYVSEFSRLARSTKDLLDIVQQLQEQNVQVVSLKERFDTTTPAGQLALTIFAAIATFERQIMLERQREGIAVARAKGVYKGRVRKAKPADWPELRARYERREISSIGALARRCHCSRPTIYRWLHEERQAEPSIT